ncbi:hypothetical protein TKK_0012405 [Trichogramma kaykai]|uniref:RPA-interacting protein C-terminal domain-containing protein n=1 Tax=Trichogramma kaykai TaxID=54128 RepID=A0ABD2WPL5_9HYME
MASQVLSPNNSRHLKNLQAARRIKNGSPKIREMLRQRCRQRMHERRDEIFLKRRHGLTNYSEEVKETLTEILHQEFENVASMEWDNPSIQLKSISQGGVLKHDESFEETFDIDEEAEEQWILEDYQNMLWDQQQIQSMFEDHVKCPICFTHLLREIPDFVVCDCGLKLPLQTNLECLKHNLREQVNIHSSSCLDVPKFSVFNDGEHLSLCLTCLSCDAFALF